jgi:biotin transporter BioY
MGWPYEAHPAATRPMKRDALLRVVSLLSILIMSLHITDDIVRGLSPAAPENVGAVAIFTVWLVGTLILGERRSGYVIMLLGGVFAAAMPVLHMNGAGYAAIAKSSGGFFFVWSLIAVGSTGVLSVILAVRALWLLQRSKTRASPEAA